MTDAEPGTSDGKGAALITGGSRGIGYELARLFAATGHDLVLVARSEDALREAAEEFEDEYGVEATPIAMDLARPDAPEELHEATAERDVQVDVLVNNASLGTHGAFTETDLEAELDQIQLGVATVTHLTKLYLREMEQRGHGKVLNVGSVGGFQPGPYMAVYTATKAYMLSFTQSLAEETSDGIGVTVLCPGPVDTGYYSGAGMESPAFIPDNDPETVARRGYEGLMAGETVVIPSRWIRTGVFLERFLPRSVVRKVFGWFVRRY